ncbi:hypothetical protein FGG08_003309 [Glutinoglossum americanum]|uniref:tRNA-splicing endonuclease subunit Sen2 n=1 Tax=Glutinoglossum americanum TaxID=1670608 RepID=A0A9P8L3N8_9PEZI|nr:hypothetical protein FGG08_003309 [Glutinoglossum americanum]
MASSLDVNPEALPSPPGTIRPVTTPRPSLNEIYGLPIPLTIHPVPTFFPTNPLWLLQFAYNCVYQIFFSSSHPNPHLKGYFSLETRSVHITEESTTKILWQQGFFGKGSLSRSEPTWLNREMRKRGLLAKVTSEEITRKRREERKEFKKERAKKEREAIERRLKEEGKLPTNDAIKAQKDAKVLENGHANGIAVINENGGPETTLEDPLASADASVEGTRKRLGTDINGGLQSTQLGKRDAGAPNMAVRFSADFDLNQPSETEPAPPTLPHRSEVIENKEHLQLMLEEAFFLVYGLGVLDVVDPETHTTIPTPSLLRLFRHCSYFPPISTRILQPDDPFMLSYVVYHHFRSLGWVVRSGIKFGVDFLLYNRGPVFSHAEFAVVILPSYGHPHYSSSEVHKKETEAKEKRSWWWLHCVNRVQSQVKKSLLIVYVEVPPPPSYGDNESMKDQGTNDINALFKTYKVREVSLKRWIPNRTRD